MAAEEREQILSIEDQQRRSFQRDRARRARAAVEQRQLPELLARAADGEDDLRAGVVLHVQLDAAGADDVQRVARLAEGEHLFAGCKLAAVENVLEIGSLGVVQQLEQRAARENLACLHLHDSSVLFCVKGGTGPASPQ